MNTNKMTLGSGSKAKLLAAFAVLAVAFVVLAAIPAVDAADDEPVSTQPITTSEGLIEALKNGGDYKIDANGLVADLTKLTSVTESDVTYYNVPNDLTIDLNGHDISVNSNHILQVAESKTLTLKDSSEDNATITWRMTQADMSVLGATTSATIKLDGIILDTNGCALFPYGDAAEIDVKNSTVKATIYAIATNNQVTGTNALTIKIDGSTLTTATDDHDNTTFLINAANVTATIKDSVLNGERQTLVVRCGTATVTNTTINYANNCADDTDKAASYDDDTWNQGNRIVRSAVVVGDRNEGSYAGTATLTIDGGKIIASGGIAVYVHSDTNTAATLDLGKTNATEIKIGANSASIGNLAIAGSGTNAELFKISQGSVVISGTMSAASANARIAAASGDVVLKDLTITDGTLTLDKNITAKGTVTINDGATLAIAEKAALNIEGTVSGSVVNNGAVNNNGGDISGATILNGPTGTIDNANMENVNIDGNIKGDGNTYGADQIVTIVGNSEIQKGATLTINGKLVVKEGVTLTLLAGSKLVLANNAVLDVQGTIAIEESYGVSGQPDYVRPGILDITLGTVNVYGTIDASGYIYVDAGAVAVQQDGVLNVLEEGVLGIREYSANPQYKFVVMDSGIMNVYGSIAKMTKSGDEYTIAYDAAASFENSGTIVFDSRVTSSGIQVDMKNGAVVDVKNIMLSNTGCVILKDQKNSVQIQVKAGTKSSSSADITGNDNVKALVSGISVSETVTSKTTNSTCVMTVSGNVAISPVNTGSTDIDNMAAEVTISLFGSGADGDKSKLTIGEGLTVGENVIIDNKGTLEVTVLVDATKGAVKNTDGKITVSGSGSIVTKTGITSETGVSASKYETGTSDDKRVYYVTLDNALAVASIGTTKKIDVLGTQELTASADLVTGATLNVKAGAKVTIKSGDEDSNVVLTVKSGATFTGESSSTGESFVIDVKGTVYAEKKTDIKTNAKAALDAGAAVYSEDIDERNRPVSNGWAKWTNVYTAMADSTLTVVKLKNAIVLDKNLTIPEGKTLDTNGNNVTAEKNVVVTVEGTLAINGGSVVTLAKVTGGESADRSASIVVKGLIQSDAEIDIKTATTATPSVGGSIILLGAYYQLDGKYCMTTVEKAAAIISTVDEQKIQIRGESTDKLTVAGDIAFAGKSAEPKAVIDVQVKEIAFSGSVSIDNAVIVFPAETKVSGTFANGSGSVALKGMVPATAAGATSANTLSVSSETKDGTAVLTVSGKLGDISETDKQTFTVTGAVTVDGIALDNAVVDGTLTVKSNSTISDKLTVNGTVSISKPAVLTSSAVTEVQGAITVAEDARFVAKKMYIGTTESAIGAGASVTGTVELTDGNSFAVVAAGSTADAFTAEGSTFKSTAYYVDNGLYVTVYANGTNTVAIKDIEVKKENAWFSAWKNDDGDEVSGEVIGTDGFAKVTADFKVDIFTVKVTADSAVDNLYLDGNLMVKNYYGFEISGLAAGAHTFSYTLKNGYSGEGTFKILSDGKSTVSGKTLTLSGTPASQDGITVELQLTGFTASGYAPVTPVTPSEDKDDGLTITDYLLIVLVVLIVIMAVIVAMRLMRS